jgi:hypothetical protein
MKKITLLGVLLMILFSSSNAQRSSLTTMATFEYITGRLVNDIRTSYGYKPGAQMVKSKYENKISWNDGWRKATLYYYKENGVIVAYVIQLHDSWNNFDMRCMPMKSSDEAVIERSRRAIYKDSDEWKIVYVCLLMDIARENL